MIDTIEQLLGDVRDIAEFSEERAQYLQDRLTLADSMLDFLPQLPPHDGSGSTAALIRVGPPHHPIMLEEGSTTIGRKHASVGDKNISRRHFELQRSGGHVTLTDCSSRNGTWVNGNRVASRTLCDGDLIEAGSTAFVFFRL